VINSVVEGDSLLEGIKLLNIVLNSSKAPGSSRIPFSFSWASVEVNSLSESPLNSFSSYSSWWRIKWSRSKNLR